MNKITLLYKNITDNDLLECLKDIADSKNTGSISNESKIREIGKEHSNIINQGFDLTQTILNIYSEAAFRWYEIEQTKNQYRER